jgi:1-acyl-sn-glycerol-3-phosphate acyltransferase
MFPEGTRRTGPTIDPEHMRDGVAYVASRAQIPIVPLGIGGSEKAMPPGAKYLRPTKLVLVVGEPMAPPPLKESGRVSRSGMRATTAELRARLQSLFDDAQRRAGHLAP